MAFLDGNGVTTLVRKLKTKFQETLVSGTNIKTVNGNSILGSGDLVVSGGSDKITGVENATQGEIVLFGADGYTAENGGWTLGSYGVRDPYSILGVITLTDSKIKENHNTWYGTCPTGATAQTKVVTTSSGDFSLTTGSMVRVKFTSAQTYNGGIKLNVDGTGAKDVMSRGTTATLRYFFLAGEVVDFVYDGTNYIAVNEGIATTTYYGVTKLSSATNSTSAAMAATPAAVKSAYDLANGKPDLDDIYPVGSVYYSAGGVDPNTAFGGTWTSTSVPYICSSKTEEATSEGWFWRKWSDGTSECWGNFTTSETTTWTAWGSLYYSNSQYYNYPTDLFVEGVYSFQASVAKASQDIISIGIGTGGTRDRTPNMYALRAGSAGNNTHCVYQVRAIGKWTTEPLTNIRWVRTA